MPLNPEAVGSEGEPYDASWTSKDALLYAVGIGAGTAELAYTTENTNGVDQQVFGLGSSADLIRLVESFAVRIDLGGGGRELRKVIGPVGHAPELELLQRPAIEHRPPRAGLKRGKAV